MCQALEIHQCTRQMRIQVPVKLYVEVRVALETPGQFTCARGSREDARRTDQSTMHQDRGHGVQPAVLNWVLVVVLGLPKEVTFKAVEEVDHMGVLKKMLHVGDQLLTLSQRQPGVFSEQQGDPHGWAEELSTWRPDPVGFASQWEAFDFYSEHNVKSLGRFEHTGDMV